MNAHKLKLKLIKDKVFERKCYGCNNTEWLEKPIPIELHHIDGNKSNNDISNLKILCPNCHAQTPNYRGRVLNGMGKKWACIECSKKVSRGRARCKSCASFAREASRSVIRKTKINWPLNTDLVSLVESSSCLQASKQLGVTPNAIKRRLQRRGLWPVSGVLGRNCTVFSHLTRMGITGNVSRT
jgi:hypothetical protein